jgi:hypothetical protein
VQHPCPPLTANVERVVTTPSNGGANSALHRCLRRSRADCPQWPIPHSEGSAPDADMVLALRPAPPCRRGAYRNLLLSKLEGKQPVTKRITGNVTGIAQQQAITVNAAFSQAQVDKILAEFSLPFNTPLSVLAVELFNSEYLVIRDQYIGNAPELDASNRTSLLRTASSTGNKTTGGGAAAALAIATASDEISTRATDAAVAIDDPLGQELGSQRILRVSPLTPVRAIC